MAPDERFPEVPSTLAGRLAGLTASFDEAPKKLGEEEPLAGASRPIPDLRSESERGRRYVSEGVIGRGGMGEVHRVIDTDLRRSLAMKVLLVDDASSTGPDPVTLARFLEEAQITGQLDHPGIVPLHELGIDAEGRVYFTMRLVRGHHLGEVFEKARTGQDGWSLPLAVEAMVKVADAMAFAHEKGVIHRDLKPQNIMAGRFGEVYVMDWGLAKVKGRPEKELRRDPTATLARVDIGGELAAGSVTVAGQVCGTPAFMSPEQARADMDRVDARSDIYSFGSILYELLAGHSPYVWKGASIDAIYVFRAILERPPRPIREAAPAAPVDLAAICQKAIARDPADRYQDMQAVAKDLRAWLAGRPVSALPLNAVTRTLRWCRRSPWVAAALLAITVGAGFGLWRLTSLTTELGLDSAREATDRESKALEAVTKFYSDSVVAPIRMVNPSLVKDDWAEGDKGFIPLPATFLTTLADKLSKPEGVTVRHYSKYPFRPRHRELDEFENRALQVLSHSSVDHVEAVEEHGGRSVLRYATARKMETSCLGCHNDPKSPKQGWREHDVRGVLEIIRPLTPHDDRAHAGISSTLKIVALVIAGLTLLAALALVRSVRRERH